MFKIRVSKDDPSLLAMREYCEPHSLINDSLSLKDNARKHRYYPSRKPDLDDIDNRGTLRKEFLRKLWYT